MRISDRADLGHLTYCTNIHAGESWPATLASLERNLPLIKAAVAPGKALGVGLRLSAAAAAALAEPATLDGFRRFLADGGYYVFTLNGFPYGAFHGQPVKEQVYQPDWTYQARLAYTNRLADQLAALLPDGMTGSVSTVPGTFKPLALEPGVVEQIAANLIRHAAHLVALEARTGRTIALALEPEPFCFLETIEETIGFFEAHLFSAAAAARLAELSGLSRGEAAEALRRHLGVCYDVCHAAVEFEDPAGSIAALRAAGIAIPKLQLSAALRIPKVEPATAAQLAPFDERVYLHQVVERRAGRLVRYRDLPDALGRIGTAEGHEWRIHFHVPIFLDQLEAFATTQDFLRQILALHRQAPISEHLEVETYTWDVLPAQHRNVDVAEAIARELRWVKGELGG
jgi:sugar phosphate isomerase/epimerase